MKKNLYSDTGFFSLMKYLVLVLLPRLRSVHLQLGQAPGIYFIERWDGSSTKHVAGITLDG